MPEHTTEPRVEHEAVLADTLDATMDPLVAAFQEVWARLQLPRPA